MKEKLEKILEKYELLEKKASDPEIISNQNEYKKITKELSDISKIKEEFLLYKKLEKHLEDVKKTLSDGELKEEEKELFLEEEKILEEEIKEKEKEIRLLLVPSDPNDERNVILEIRAGTGGEEASIFGADLLRMYLRWIEREGFSGEILSKNETGLDGIKEATILIKGKKAYSKLKYESGVHRVQRVPQTESQGRVHTSAASVVVLPEADKVDVEVNPADIKVDIYRSSGAGGQHVNTTDSAVRLTHVPSGIVVTCQDERSQHKNKDKALKILYSRLLKMKEEEQQKEIAGERASKVGSGDRSERIRTYNFPQNRVSDHRINLTLYKLDSFIDGDMNEMLDALAQDDKAKKIAES